MGSAALERHHAREHRALEVPAVLDVVRWETEVLLVDVLALDEEPWNDEPARAELPAARSEVVADAGQRAVHSVVARAHEELFVFEEPIDGIDSVLVPGPI